MADLSVLSNLGRAELVELASVLATRLGALADDALTEARIRAAERDVERRGKIVEGALADYVRTKALHDRAIAERRTSNLSGEIGRLTAAHRVACDRERKALRRLGRLRMEAGR